ncbi:MAG: hypothetical protein ACXABY_36935, partial [Candidatus Thorarchaeota archaeon]
HSTRLLVVGDFISICRVSQARTAKGVSGVGAAQARSITMPVAIVLPLKELKQRRINKDKRFIQQVGGKT